MKHPSNPQSATSIPSAPDDDVTGRMKRYAITMAIRTACFLAMALVTPYSWYTWIFAAGAIFLPYIAVVFANVGVDAKAVSAVAPERTLDAATPAPQPAEEAKPTVIRIEESRDAAPDA